MNPRMAIRLQQTLQLAACKLAPFERGFENAESRRAHFCLFAHHCVCDIIRALERGQPGLLIGNRDTARPAPHGASYAAARLLKLALAFKRGSTAACGDVVADFPSAPKDMAGWLLGAIESQEIQDVQVAETVAKWVVKALPDETRWGLLDAVRCIHG